MAQTKYCNATTDLLRAYPKIFEGFREKRIITGYSFYATVSVPPDLNVFSISGLGYIESMTEDEVSLTAKTTYAGLNAVKQYFYDSTTDTLYFTPTDGLPDNYTYGVGESWSTLVSDAQEMGSRDAEAVLDTKYEVPIPMSPDGTADRPWDRDFVHAVALLACAHIAERFEPARFDGTGNPIEGNVAAMLRASGERIVKDYVDGRRVFSWEITEDEVGGHNIRPASTNTSAGIIQLRGKYNPDIRNASIVYPAAEGSTYIFTDPFWKVKIVLGGVLGTATFTVSKDNGTTYPGSTVATSNQWCHIDNDVWIRFLPFTSASTFVINDTWQIEVYNPLREVTSQNIRSKSVDVL
jgi:hypothetical protein